jgi:hypothetical protein
MGIMRYVFPACLAFAALCLTACAVPGRDFFAPNPAGADTASISATQTFAGRVPLITILPGTTDYAGPVAKAVREALAIKPGAKFEVQATAPVKGTPDASVVSLSQLSGTAADVAKSIISDGVAAQNVTLTAKTAGLSADILVYVK